MKHITRSGNHTRFTWKFQNVCSSKYEESLLQIWRLQVQRKVHSNWAIAINIRSLPLPPPTSLGLAFSSSPWRFKKIHSLLKTSIKYGFTPEKYGSGYPWRLVYPGLSLRGREPGISSSYYERGPRLLSKENRRKIESKETPSCFIADNLLYLPCNLKS